MIDTKGAAKLLHQTGPFLELVADGLDEGRITPDDAKTMLRTFAFKTLKNVEKKLDG
jgi:hypothetical protein